MIVIGSIAMSPSAPSAVILHIQSVSALVHSLRSSDGATFEAVLAKQRVPLTNTSRAAVARDLQVQDVGPIAREISSAVFPDDIRAGVVGSYWCRAVHG